MVLINNMASSITFNSYDLQTSSIVTEKILHTSSPENNLQVNQKMRRDGSILFSNYWTKKNISASGHILGSSISDLDSKIDTLKQNLVGENLDLDIGYAGGTRRYRATVKRINIDREHFNGSWCPFSIEFVCVDAFGKDTSTTSVTQDNNTSSPFTKVVTIGGSFPAFPTISLDFTSGSNVTAVKIENVTTGEFITIPFPLDSRTFADAEILIVDCNNMTVQISAVNIDFSGVFPKFVVGSNTVRITVSGSPFDIDLDITYTPLYI